MADGIPGEVHLLLDIILDRTEIILGLDGLTSGPKMSDMIRCQILIPVWLGTHFVFCGLHFRSFGGTVIGLDDFPLEFDGLGRPTGSSLRVPGYSPRQLLPWPD